MNLKNVILKNHCDVGLMMIEIMKSEVVPTNMSPTFVSVNLVGIILESMHVKNMAFGCKCRIIQID